ncbi:thiamine phosphate synthase [Afifella pfennigii]|uniref:thiamine phosphate synthase n=1 Tax=Afifella pfennigii TaxID=209897 RepID=UPI0004795B70|nr:thiamine phosphate synthase [Afifella pfennigii]
MRRAFDLSLYLVTDPRLAGERDFFQTVEAAVAGGVSLVQLRDPDAGTRDLVAIARRLVELLAPRGVPLIVNDRTDVALAAEAAGVHLGQSDMDGQDARRLIGPEKILGISVGSAAEHRASQLALGQADYIGVGPVYQTGTKADAGAAIGTAGLSALVSAIDLPAVAIGGIAAGKAAPCIAAGAEGVAVVSAIMAAPDPQAAARTLSAEIIKAKEAK